MAPSPALRFSPGWELSAENSHKRGRSLESGLTLKSKDDDLLLFNEMQNQEKDNFLLHTADDFDESLSKLRHFSNFKLGINIPTRGESSDLLNVEADKSDYDWLLTPPDTPLFSSLDDEYPQPINLAPRSRARSQPIMNLRSVNEKSYQTSRTSSSPHRLSPSPRSSGTLSQMRGRPFSGPRSSPPHVNRSATPTRRPSTSPNKQLAPNSSSSTPTLRRASTGSSIHSSNYGVRGPSPVNASCGNSVSPKLRGWQMTLPGFTSEAPPNLRTSLPDRPLSHTRGSSPASRNGSESSGRHGRKSMSPTSSRSISSSHSHERDCFSSYSKCSIVSSSDDYEESLRSMTVGISRSPLTRKDTAMGSKKAISFSRKPSRNSPANCIPKRSFDSAVRLRDQHKTPQNMFRPLLSSAPATTFRPIFSRNSSLTTSSNASSEQGVINVAVDMEGSKLEPTELPVGWGRTEDSETHEEVFLFDKVDEIIKDSSHEALSRRPQGCDDDFGETLAKKFDSEDVQNPMVHIGVETKCSTLESAHFTHGHCNIDGHTMMAVCSKCGKKFKILDLTEAVKFCQECIDEENFCTTGIALNCVPLTKIVVSHIDTAIITSGKELYNSEVPEFHEGNGKVMLCQHEKSIILGADSLSNICPIHLLDQRESELFGQHLGKKDEMNVSGDCSINTPQLSNYAVNPNLKVDISEGTGISVLLMQRSVNSKWPILQGKTVSAINILCSEPSYSRENTNASRRSIGRDSPSASSSVDLGSSRPTETSIQHQLFREGKEDIMRNDIDCNAQSMCLPNLSINCYEPRHLKSECEETSNSSTNCLGYDSSRVITEEHNSTLDQSNFNAIPSSSRSVISEYYISEHTDTYREKSSLECQQILDHQGNNYLPYSSAAEIMFSEECASSIHEISIQSVEGRTDISGCSEMEDDYTMSNCTFQNDNFDEATKSSSILSIELQHGYSELDYQTESTPSHCPDYQEKSNGHSISQTSACDIPFSTSEPITAVQEFGNHDEPCIMVECSGGRMSRSLTLEEATDTILFCSSIIHDLAYQAAMNGIEKELNLRSEAQTSAPTLTLLDKPIPGLRDSVKMQHKPTPSSQKFRRKRIESQAKSPSKELEKYAVKANAAFTAPDVEIARKVDSIKPPKLESKCNCTVM